MLLRASLSIAAVALASACAHRDAEIVAARGAQTEITAASLRSCDLPDERGDAPTFAFDSAQLSDSGRDLVSRIAACIRNGRLGPGRLVVMGYADPRGPTDYNRQLGLYRALAVRELLVELGVPESSVRVVSEGERDARGHDERTWALDRRVEIRVEDSSER